jgi:pimeloyl-ACP methyl ester carboxylesterase
MPVSVLSSPLSNLTLFILTTTSMHTSFLTLPHCASLYLTVPHSAFHSQPFEQGVTWIGSSMGGLIGTFMSFRSNSYVRRLVLNDIGPFVPKEALQRIAGYVGKDPSFDSIDEVNQYFRTCYESMWGPSMNDETFAHITEHGHRIVQTEADGKQVQKYHLAYDPDIRVPFSDAKALENDVDLWPVFNMIKVPILVLHGKDSDILLESTAQKMAERDNVELVQYPDTAHLPPLMTNHDIKDILTWLSKSQS